MPTCNNLIVATGMSSLWSAEKECVLCMLLVWLYKIVTALLDKIPEISIDGIQKNFEKISGLDKIIQDMKTKKDKILKEVQGVVKNEKKEKILEKYTEEDKNKLNDLLETFSDK